MELEEAKKTMKNFLKDTPKLPYDCIANHEIVAVETILNHLTKQEKMIELLIEDLQGEGCLNMTREEIDNFYERRIKLVEESE